MARRNRWRCLLLVAFLSSGLLSEEAALGQSLTITVPELREKDEPAVESLPARRSALPQRKSRGKPTSLLASGSRVFSVPADEFAINDAQAVILMDPGDCFSEDSPAFWVRGEIGVWWIEGFSVPPLVTTSTIGTPRTNAGVLGEPTTSILFGNDRLSEHPQLGGRLGVGGWLGPCGQHGIEVILFTLTQPQPSFTASSSGTPILARPFFNVEPGFEGQDAELTAFPGELEGSLSITGETTFYGGELLYRHAVGEFCQDHTEVIAGYRYNRLDEELVINDFKRVLSGATGLAVGTTLTEVDRFTTENIFHGGEVGLLYERRWCNWSLEGQVKVALGNTHSKVAINGSTTVTVPVPGAPDDVTVTPAGLYAQQTNSGVFEQDDFAVIPELGLNAWYEFLPNLRAGVGYSFIYWSRVARPGDQIDTNLNLSQLPPGPLTGIPRPEFQWVVTDLWLQGVNVGIDWSF